MGVGNALEKEWQMAKTNFAYEKRQRELEKKKKQEEKARRKAELKNNPGWPRRARRIR
jgi:hypothetical protein